MIINSPNTIRDEELPMCEVEVTLYCGVPLLMEACIEPLIMVGLSEWK